MVQVFPLSLRVERNHVFDSLHAGIGYKKNMEPHPRSIRCQTIPIVTPWFVFTCLPLFLLQRFHKSQLKLAVLLPSPCSACDRALVSGFHLTAQPPITPSPLMEKLLQTLH